MDIANPKNDEREEGAAVKIQCTFDSKIFQNTNSKYCIVRMKTADRSIPANARNKEDVSGRIIQVALAEIDGIQIKADIWYGVDLLEREVEML